MKCYIQIFKRTSSHRYRPRYDPLLPHNVRRQDAILIVLDQALCMVGLDRLTHVEPHCFTCPGETKSHVMTTTSRIQAGCVTLRRIRDIGPIVM